MSIHERWKSNPALYRKLGEPRPVADAEAAVGKFHEAVGKLREEHGILNCAVVVSVPIVAEESETGEGIGTVNDCQLKQAALRLGLATGCFWGGFTFAQATFAAALSVNAKWCLKNRCHRDIVSHRLSLRQLKQAVSRRKIYEFLLRRSDGVLHDRECDGRNPSGGCGRTHRQQNHKTPQLRITDARFRQR